MDEDSELNDRSPGLVDEHEQDASEDRQLVGDLSAIFNTIDRVVTMMRVYPLGHPLLDDLASQLLARMQPTLDRETNIIFNVDAKSLQTIDGVEFFSQQLADKAQYIWYAPYADGMLQVKIDDTVPREELVAFLRVVERAARGDIASDDDTVTLMWEQQFKHISYFAVEGFVDSGTLEQFGDLTEQDAVELIVNAALEPGGESADSLGALFDNTSLGHIDLFTRMQVEANAAIIPPELKDSDLAYAFAVGEELLANLNEEWASGADLEYRLIEALLAIIRVAPTSDGAQRAAEMITTVIQQMLDNQLYPPAVRMLELLHDRRELFVGAAMDPLGELVTKLSDPMQIEALVNIFQVNKATRPSIARLFRLLGRTQVAKQVLNLLADPKRTVVALRELVELLLELNTPEVEPLFTQPALLKQSIYLRRMLSELGGVNFREFAPTTRLIRKALDDEDPQVRELALDLDHPCWNDPEIAAKYLQPMATDPNEGIRRLALKLLGEKHPPLFYECIKDTVMARKLGDRSLAEVRYLMRIVIDNGGAEHLRALVDVRGWFGGDAIEYAKMAAAVLIEAGDADGIALVQAKARHVLTAPALKKSYQTSLERFLAPAPDAPASAAEEDLDD